MLFRFINSDLFNAPASNNLYVQCGSADLALGAGIAVEFNKRYNVKERAIEQITQPPEVGDIIYLDKRFEYDTPVVTLITKAKYNNKPTYGTLVRALMNLKQYLWDHKEITILSMPAIGCGLDKLDIDEVCNILITVFNDTQYEICMYILDQELCDNLNQKFNKEALLCRL